jgi:L-lysine exporter family protein LysE/ArgO
MIDAFLYGAILALGLIVPLGIQNIFIFNQGATQPHFLHAIPSVLTAAICDSILILLAVLGVSVAVLAMPALKMGIFVVGFFFLTYMGWVTWRAKPARLNTQQKPLSAKRQIMFAASVSLLNPHALIDTIGVIGTNALNFVDHARWVYTFTCIAVAFIWFFGLSMAGYFVHRLDQTGNWLTRMNKLSALIIWGVAIYIGWQIFQDLHKTV